MKKGFMKRAFMLWGMVGIFSVMLNSCGSFAPTLPAPVQPPQPGAPKATTGLSSGVTQDSATMTGTVNPRGADTIYYFEFWIDPENKMQTTQSSAGSGFADVNVSFELTGLQPNTTYHYRLVATNSYGTTYGAERTFTTQAPPPTYQVTLQGVSAVSDTSGQNALVSGLPISGPEIPVQ